MAVEAKKEYRIKRIEAWKLEEDNFEDVVEWVGDAAEAIDAENFTITIAGIICCIDNQIAKYADDSFAVMEDGDLLAVYELIEDPI